MSKVLIVTGGSVNVAWAKEWLDNQIFDYCIAADSGLEYADKLGLKVDFLLGDYDSVDKDVLDRYTENPPHIRIMGKGMKVRAVPILPATAKNEKTLQPLGNWLREN